MGGSTPWWGTLVVAFVGLAGVLFTVWRSDHRERTARRSDQESRLLDMRADVYFRYLLSIEGLADGLTGRSGDSPRWGSRNFDEMFGELQDLDVRMRVLSSDVVLFIYSQVKPAILELIDAVDELEEAENEEGSVRELELKLENREAVLRWLHSEIVWSIRDEFGIEQIDEPALKKRQNDLMKRMTASAEARKAQQLSEQR